MVVGILYFGFPTTCEADYTLILPEVGCTPPLPYTVTEDQYVGAACVQMAINACPNVSERKYYKQADIFARIGIHNSESTWYTGDPAGILGTLEDPLLAPCGNWLDFSNKDKNFVLGNMLYLMNSIRYLTPVLIGNGQPWEHWVTVYGYTTSNIPSTSTLSVNLYSISFYDPTPGSVSDCCVSGTVWLNDTAYWGAPLNKPGSKWHDNYVAVIEPPAVNIQVNVSPWVISGPILSVSRIEESLYKWFKEVKEKSSCCSFKILALASSLKIQKPILIDAGNYQYYLVPFENSRLAAIFNSYTGQFEELRYFQEPRRYISDSQIITTRLKEILSLYKPKTVEITGTQLRYNPGLAVVGRFSPLWQAVASVTDFYGKKHELNISLNSAGQVIKGLESLHIPTTPSHVEPIEKKRPLFSIHTGTAVPLGNFADLYKAGINILVDFEYPLKKRFALRTLLGYNQFKSKLVGLDDTSIFNINLNLKYSTPGKPLTFFAEAGPGYYIMKDADNKMGVNVGCGLNFRLSEKVLLEFAAHHNTIFTSDKNTYFLHLSGGFIIRF